MRIDRLHVANFKGFEDRNFLLHPQFNLIVGVNGTGKTSLLDALSVALGSWLLGIRGYDTRHIRPQEVLLADYEVEDLDEDGERHFSVNWEQKFPCLVSAEGEIMGQTMTWQRSLNTPGGRTTYGDAVNIKMLAAEIDNTVRAGGDVILPLISYYGTGRLWDTPREQAQVNDEKAITPKEKLSRLAGYRNSVDPRLSVSNLVRWIARQSWITYQQGGKSSPIYEAVKRAILNCVEGATSLYFNAAIGEVIVEMGIHGTQPFNNLSDGQRCMMAMVGDIAHKAAILNPQLGSKVTEETPGVVLIDELDLHLHPKWQRRVIEDLRRTFPKIQFIATTHSPFLIQTLREGELMMLDGEPTTGYAGRGIEEVVRYIMGVEMPETSPRFAEMKEVASEYFKILEQGKAVDESKKQKLKLKLEAMTAPYADNPAYVAFLEQKRTAAGIE
jgi:predicted ATP-binding protein involved in virulence